MAYALITGASKGIGKAIAGELAKRKMNVLLIARNEAELAAESQRLVSTYGIKADFLSMDLTAPHAVDTVMEWIELRGYDVQVLVNNAGYGLSGPFEKFSAAEWTNMMRLNMEVLVTLTRRMLPELKKQSRAYILNVASTAAYQAIPMLAAYAASKAFVLSFSRGLHQELKDQHIVVTAVSPGPTDTAFIDRAQIGEKGKKAAMRMNMSSAEVAKIAVGAMFKGKAEVIAGGLNKLGSVLAWLLPKGLIERTTMKIYE